MRTVRWFGTHKKWIPVGEKSLSSREIMDEYAEKLSISKWQDWYRVTSLQFSSLKGSSKLLADHGNSYIRAVTELYPEHPWRRWCFGGSSPSMWDDKSMQRQLFDHIWKDLNLKSWEDWYQVTSEMIKGTSGATGFFVNGNFKRMYSSCVSVAIATLYPEYSWKLWKFEKVPEGFWLEVRNQRDFFDHLARDLDVNTLNDWYSIPREVIMRNGGNKILRRYGGNQFKALQAIYPEHCWKLRAPRVSHVKEKVPYGMWKNHQFQRDFLDRISKDLGIEKWQDWYRIKNDDVIKKGGVGLILQRGSLLKALAFAYPEHPWAVKNNWKSQESKTQLRLFRMMQEMFPSVDVFRDFVNEDLRYNDSDIAMELDVFIPSFSLALEYQGRYHYEEVAVHGLNSLDKEKRIACMLNGITMIQIPHWWDEERGSLCATIISIRPDLLEKLKIEDRDSAKKSKKIPDHEMKNK